MKTVKLPRELASAEMEIIQHFAGLGINNWQTDRICAIAPLQVAMAALDEIANDSGPGPAADFARLALKAIKSGKW